VLINIKEIGDIDGYNENTIKYSILVIYWFVEIGRRGLL